MDILVLTNDDDKKCPRCGRYRPTTSFYRSGEVGLQSYCIACKRDYNKLRAAETKVNKLGFKETPLGSVVKMAAGLTSKERTDLRNALKYIASKIK